MTEVTINRKIYGKNSLSNLIDTQFSQLAETSPKVIAPGPTSVEKFFSDYDEVFYQIPLTGDKNSQQELLNRSSEALGISLEELQQEIVTLREENVALKQQIIALTNTSNNDSI